MDPSYGYGHGRRCTGGLGVCKVIYWVRRGKAWYVMRLTVDCPLLPCSSLSAVVKLLLSFRVCNCSKMGKEFTCVTVGLNHRV